MNLPVPECFSFFSTARSTRRFSSSTILILVLAAVTSPLVASGQNTVFKIPPVKIPLDIKDQPITITTSAILTISPSKDRSQWTVNLGVTGDLSDLQNNLTVFLSAQMDKDDRADWASYFISTC